MNTLLRNAATVCVFASMGAAPSDLGSKVVAYATAHLHEQVGDGQCAVLASSALKEVGAKGRYKDAPNKGDYVWGDLAVVVEAAAGTTPKVSSGALSDIRPGDIVQLRDVKLTHHAGRSWSSQSMEHHTAVVTSTEDGGKTIHVLQQNCNGKLIVMPGTYKLNDLTTGWLRFYHPTPKE